VTDFIGVVCYMLYVDPTYQGKGFGKRLMNFVLEQVDAAGKKAWLEGTPAGYVCWQPIAVRSVIVEEISC